MRLIRNPKPGAQKPSTQNESQDPGAALDFEIARQIGEGDREALARLLDRHLSAVYTYVARRLGPEYEDLAADVTRATFQQALRRIKPYARGTASKPMRLWLLKLASDQLADEHISSDDDTAGRWPSDDVMRLHSAFRKLSSRQQTVLSLALFEGLHPEEIAAASGLGLPRAMRLLHSSLRRTGEILDASEEA